VGDIPVRVGDRVTTATQLMTLDQPGSLEAYVYVPIEHSAQLKMNLPVQVVDSEGKVLAETRREAVAASVRALVFVGDAMEESADALCATAGELGLLKVPVFMFQEGEDAAAEQTFREIARLTGGAWCRFDPGAAAQLRDLLRAVAAYAAGGRAALLQLAKTTSGAARLIGQMK